MMSESQHPHPHPTPTPSFLQPLYRRKIHLIAVKPTLLLKSWKRRYLHPHNVNNGFTHRGRATHICVRNLIHNWFKLRLVAFSATIHYLNQCWNIANLTLRNKLQWSFNRNSYIKHLRKCILKYRLRNGGPLCRDRWVNLRYYVPSQFELNHHWN